MEDSLPRAPLHGDGSFGPYCRLRCQCCGAPTLWSPDMIPPSQASDPSFVQSCVLCEWDNPLHPDAPDPPPTDDALSLAEAQANFDRYHWMYDPGHPPDWLPQPVPAVELATRQELRNVFQAIDREPFSD